MLRLLTYPLPRGCLGLASPSPSELNRARQFRWQGDIKDGGFNVRLSILTDGLLSSIRRSRLAGTNPRPSETSDHHVIVRSDTLRGHCFHIMKPRELPTAGLIITLCTACVCVCASSCLFTVFEWKQKSCSVSALLCVCAQVQHGGVFFASVRVCPHVACVCARVCASASTCVHESLREVSPAIIELGLCI